MGVASSSTGKFSHLGRKGPWTEIRGCGRRHQGKGLSMLIFSHQKMSPSCWVGLIRSQVVSSEHRLVPSTSAAGAIRARGRRSMLFPPNRRGLPAFRVTKPIEVRRNVFPSTFRGFVCSTQNTEPLHPPGVDLNSCSLHLRW